MLNVRIVALVVVALCAVSIPIKAVFVVRRILSPLKSKTTQQTHVTFGVCSLMYDVTTLAYGVLKIVDPKKFVIGNLVNANNAIDVVFFLNSSCYVPVLHCIVLNLSHFLLGSLRIIPAQYRDKVSATIDRVEHRAIYAPILGVVLGVVLSHFFLWRLCKRHLWCCQPKLVAMEDNVRYPTVSITKRLKFDTVEYLAFEFCLPAQAGRR
jgi:hypothetical protein